MSIKTFSPETPAQALQALSLAGKYLPVAGGTNVLVDLGKGKIAPEGLVDLSRLEAWKRIKLKGQGCRESANTKPGNTGGEFAECFSRR